MTAPAEDVPRPVPGLPGWAWWPGKDGHPCARRPGMPVVQAPDWTVLLARIRRAEEGARAPVNDQIAELEHLFPDSGWVFGTVWQTANSRPDARSLTARKGGILLAAADVPGLAEKVRREEGRMPG